MTILAIDPSRRTNARLIAEVAALGYLTAGMLTLDATYGLGRFWTEWAPDRLIGADLDPERARDVCADFTDLPFPDATFDAVVFDPPYKLNGTGGSHPSDKAYGVATDYVPAEAKRSLLLDGITESDRVLKTGGRLLVKCQDQVSSGRIHWQTHQATRHAETLGHTLTDALLLAGHRPQPAGRTQRHARRNYSTLLIFTKGTQ